MRRPEPLARELMSPAQVAELYQVSVRTLKRLVQTGHARVMPVMINPWRWRRSEVERDITTASYEKEMARARLRARHGARIAPANGTEGRAS